MQFVLRDNLFVRVASDYTTFIRHDKIVLKEPSIVVVLNAKNDKYCSAGVEVFRHDFRHEMWCNPIKCDEVCNFIAAEYMIKSFYKKIRKGVFAPNIIATCSSKTTETELRAMKNCLQPIAHQVSIIFEPHAANAFLQKNYMFNSAIFINIGLDSTRVDLFKDNKAIFCDEILDGYSEIYDIIRNHINAKHSVKIGIFGVKSILNNLSAVSKFDYTSPHKDTFRPIQYTIIKSELEHLIYHTNIRLVDKITHKLNETLDKCNDVENIFIFGGDESISEYMKLIAKKIHFDSIVPEDCSNVIVKGLKLAYEVPKTPLL